MENKEQKILLNKLRFKIKELNYLKTMKKSELDNSIVPEIKRCEREIEHLEIEYRNLISNNDIEVNVLNKVTQGDTISLLTNIPSNSVHLCLSDIPYGINLDGWDVLHNNTNSALLGSSPAQENKSAFKRRGKPINGWNNDDRSSNDEYSEWVYSWAISLYDVMKEGAPVLIFGARRTIHSAIAALEDAGFLLKDILSWEKSNAHHRSQDIFKVLIKRGKSYTLTVESMNFLNQYADGIEIDKINSLVETEFNGYKELKEFIVENLGSKFYAKYEYELLEICLTDDVLKDEVLMWKGWKLGNFAPYWEPIAWLFKPYKNVKTLTDCVLTNQVGAVNINELKIDGKEPKNIFKFDFSPDEEKFHEAQKPLELMEYIIKGFTQEGHTILDPFVGSGTTAVAAKKLKRNFIAFEMNEEYVDISNERLNKVGDTTEVEDQLTLF